MDISTYFKGDKSNSTRADKEKTKKNRKKICGEELGSSDDDFIFERKKKRRKKNEKKEVLDIIDLDPNSEPENIEEIELKMADSIKVENFPNENCKPLSEIMKGKNETKNSIIVTRTTSKNVIKNTDTSKCQPNFKYLNNNNTRALPNSSKSSNDKTIVNPRKSNKNSNSSLVTITKQHENKTTHNSNPFSSVIYETKSIFEPPTYKISIDKNSIGENAEANNRRYDNENREELSLSCVESKRGIEKRVESDEEHLLWNCEKCTFLNHELLSKCKICESERKKKGNLHLVSKKQGHYEENIVLFNTSLDEGCDKNKYENETTVSNMPSTETYAQKNVFESNSNIQNESFATNASFGNIKQCRKTKPLYDHNSSELFCSDNLSLEDEQSFIFIGGNILDDAEQLSDSTWDNSSSESQPNHSCNFKDASSEFEDSPFFMPMHHLLDDQKENPQNDLESSDISLYPSNTSNLSIWNDDLLQDKDEIDDIMAGLDEKQMMLQETVSDSSISESEQEVKIEIKKLSYRPSIYTSRVFVYDQVIPQFQQ